MPHSCAPNTIISFSESGEKAFVYAARPIRFGEPLTRSWLPDNYLSYQSRQKAFEDKFGSSKRSNSSISNSSCTCKICQKYRKDESFGTFDDMLREKAFLGRSWLDVYLNKFDTTNNIMNIAPSLAMIQNFIRLLEHSFHHSFCDVLSLRALYLTLAQKTAVRIIIV
jgi:hypothetical protein